MAHRSGGPEESDLARPSASCMKTHASFLQQFCLRAPICPYTPLINDFGAQMSPSLETRLQKAGAPVTPWAATIGHPVVSQLLFETVLRWTHAGKNHEVRDDGKSTTFASPVRQTSMANDTSSSSHNGASTTLSLQSASSNSNEQGTVRRLFDPFKNFLGH